MVILVLFNDLISQTTDLTIKGYVYKFYIEV